MECLKCGRETDQTFCVHCREDMQKYPVKPGTAVHLPKRQPDALSRKNARRVPQLTPEVQLEQQRGLIRRLLTIIIVLAVMLVLLGGLSYFVASRPRQTDTVAVGQNYSTVSEPNDFVGN